MKMGQELLSDGFPGAGALAALRAWYAGLSARAAVAHYLVQLKEEGQSSRTMISDIRRQLARFARARHREDLAGLIEHPAAEREQRGRAVVEAIEVLRCLPMCEPLVTDDVQRWLPARAARALKARGIKTLADLTVRIPRRRRWWIAIPDLGATSARQIENFFAAHAELTERARALVPLGLHPDVVPWEMLCVPSNVDGSRGKFRAPTATCALSANNDYEAVQAWLALHESVATQRAYRKEAERLILWAVVERGKAASSLTTEDAIMYRAFLRNPAPRGRWVGPARPRTASDWRPFSGGLSPRSTAYALSVAGAMFRWLIQQRYTLANPFAGIKVRGVSHSGLQVAARVFSEREWVSIRAVAEGLEWGHQWETTAAQRVRFVLDFAYATGLRISELVNATLGQIEVDSHGDHWLHLVGKGNKVARVALPPLARGALDRYLMQRRLPVTPARWDSRTRLIGSIEPDSTASITPARLWSILRRFFMKVADVIETESPVTAEKLRRASPHWMRHTHATHALARGAELTAVRDNLRHASIQTTSTYLHGDEVKRARQMEAVFGVDPLSRRALSSD
ncbi:phage integrase family protein [Variovorax sp. GB1P17]|uniref:phage integrase family protein n=1 Tax=Variovorax sp. GB1P17 TaxID=3443740 RepID=UPI003F461732